MFRLRHGNLISLFMRTPRVLGKSIDGVTRFPTCNINCDTADQVQDSPLTSRHLTHGRNRSNDSARMLYRCIYITLLRQNLILHWFKL